MKIKTKLFLGIGVLFAMIVLLIIMSGLFINKLSGDTKNILVANYNTLDYSRKMLIALNNDITTSQSMTLFKENLQKQQDNNTEIGEKDLTDKLSADFEKLQQLPGDTASIHIIRNDITDIMLLNMQAIQRKSKIAQTTASQSLFWVSIAGAICFLFAFTMLINLPGNIANPIKKLTKSIQQIAAENYSERVRFEGISEFEDLATAFNSMAEKLEEYKAGNLEKLLIEKKRIETLINNMNDPVIGLDDNNKVLFMNNIALKIAALQPGNVIGKQIQDIALRNDLVRSLIQDLFADEPKATSRQAPVKIYANDKESYFEKEIVPINIIPTGEKEEKQIGNVILLRNVTPYKELDFAKTNFIATISHELKTPIAAIQLSVNLLENERIGSLNAEQQNLVESIKDDAGRLLKITRELLDMTQVESGSIQISAIPSNAKEIADYAIGANKPAAEQKQIKLELSLSDDLPRVLADKEKTAWVLTNLLSNAIRYSYEDSTVHIIIAEENNNMKFSITDSGQGIAPQYIDKIFDRYFRIPGTRKEGTGLGLSISKEFIEAQGGSIAVKSDFGAGSTFTVTLPAYRE